MKTQTNKQKQDKQLLSYYKLVDGESDQKLPLNMIHDENEDINNFEVEDKPKINVKEFNKRFISVIDKIYERILSENTRVRAPNILII